MQYHHKKALRDACKDDAVRHALNTVPEKEYRTMCQAIFDNADLTHQRQDEWNQLRRERAPKFKSARLPQDVQTQLRRERASKFKSTVRSKPKNDVAQGPNGGTGFRTRPRLASNELKVLRNKVQRPVTPDSKVLTDRSVKGLYGMKMCPPPEVLRNKLQRPVPTDSKVLNDRSVKGLYGMKMCPPPDTFIRGTACHVNRSPSHFAKNLLKKTIRVNRKRKIKPTDLVRKTTFKFPTTTVQPARERTRHSWTTYTPPPDRTSSTPGGQVSTANTVLRWADIMEEDDDSISPPADEESTQADEETTVQCWPRNTLLESQLKVGAEFHLAHYQYLEGIFRGNISRRYLEALFRGAI